MTQKKVNPVPRCNAGTGLGFGTCIAAVSDPKISTEALVIQRLCRRFGWSSATAATIAGLAGLGSRETRHG